MYDVIIIGAGPAGLMCANNLDNDNFIVLEKKERPLSKLLITGNGRCNLTNNKSNEEFLNIIDFNKKYLYSTISLFGPQEVYTYFSNFIKLKEEEDNKIFPYSNNSKDIYNVLINKIASKIKCNENVLSITKSLDIFIIKTNNSIYKSKKIVISTGGASFPNTGSDGDHINFANSFNQDVVPLYPAETSIVLKNYNSSTSGISFDQVIVNVDKKKYAGNLMFTKNGLSGSSIMNSSGFISRENIKSININFLPNIDIEKVLEDNVDKELVGAFKNILSKKFIYYLFSNKEFFHYKIKSISKKDINYITEELRNKSYEILKVSDLKTAYVTGGGVSLNGINTKTFESKVVDNLYFAGESLDIYGPIGGYNITLALSTGYSVATAINNI